MQENRVLYNLYLHLFERDEDDQSISILNRAILSLVLLSLVLLVLGTEPILFERYSYWFDFFDRFFFIIFSAELACRLLCAGYDERYRGWKGRLRFLLSPMVIIDVVALVSYTPLVVEEFGFLRFFRALRIVSLMKRSRFVAAWNEVGAAIRSRSYELTVSLTLALAIIFFSSIFIYFVERQAQPEYFGSIPRAMWWTVVTLTTIGNGDAYPLSVVGKMFATVIAFSGIGLIGLPAGILASAMSDKFQARRNEE